MKANCSTETRKLWAAGGWCGLALGAWMMTMGLAVQASPEGGQVYEEEEGLVVMEGDPVFEGTGTYRFRIHGWGIHQIHFRTFQAAPVGQELLTLQMEGMALMTRNRPSEAMEVLGKGEQRVRVPSQPGWTYETNPLSPEGEGLFIRLSPGDYVLRISKIAPSAQLDRIIVSHHSIPLRTVLNESLATSARVEPRPEVLKRLLTDQLLGEHLLPHGEWSPYPKASNREAWGDLSKRQRSTLIRDGEKSLGYGWPSLTASTFLDYRRTGSRKPYDDLFNDRRQRLAALILAECVEGEGRFLDDLVNGIWATCEQTWWGIPAHLDERGTARGGLPGVDDPLIDLFAPEVGSLLAWAYYLLGEELDGWSPRIRERMHYEIKRRLHEPYLAHTDYNWMGLPSRWVNNHNTSIHSHLLPTTLLVEEDPSIRLRLVSKILHTLDNFIASQPPDGGCEEGPNYWGRAAGAFFECLFYLETATQGKAGLFSEALFLRMAAYLPKMHIANGEFFNYGDAERFVRVPAGLTSRIGQHLDLDTVRDLGLFLRQKEREQSGRESIHAHANLGRVLADLFTPIPQPEDPVVPPMLRDVWLPDSEIFAARDKEGSPDGFYIAAMGSHNSQSHNHNDVGGFILYKNAQPLFIDLGRENYSSIAFDYSQRYSLWYTQSAWHNLPTINGYMQEDGRWKQAEDVRYDRSSTETRLALDIAKAYPPEAGIIHFHREMALIRGDRILLKDDFSLRENGSIEWNFLTPCIVDTEVPGEVRLLTAEGQSATLFYPARKLDVIVDVREITDTKLMDAWGTTVRRIRLMLREPLASGAITFTVK